MKLTLTRKDILGEWLNNQNNSILYSTSFFVDGQQRFVTLVNKELDLAYSSKIELFHLPTEKHTVVYKNEYWLVHIYKFQKEYLAFKKQKILSLGYQTISIDRSMKDCTDPMILKFVRDFCIEQAQLGSTIVRAKLLPEDLQMSLAFL